MPVMVAPEESACGWVEVEFMFEVIDGGFWVETLGCEAIWPVAEVDSMIGGAKLLVDGVELVDFVVDVWDY